MQQTTKHFPIVLNVILALSAAGCNHSTTNPTNSGNDQARRDSTSNETENLDDLPRWAGVALTARCAQRLQPTLAKLWIDAPKAHLDLVSEAIKVSQDAAQASRTADDRNELADSITELVGELELHLAGLPSEDPEMAASLASLDDDTIKLIRDMIDIAARATRAATAADSNGARGETADGVSWTYSVIDRLRDNELRVAIDEEIASLHSICRNAEATDDHGVRWTDNRWQIALNGEYSPE